MNKPIKYSIVIVFLVFLSIGVWATPRPPQPTPPPGMPIPGVIVALVGAMGYGIYKLRSSKK